MHTNSLKSGLYGSLAARLARRPVVWHLHDRLAADYLPARAVTLMRRAVRVLPTTLVTNSEATRATVPRPPRSGVTVVPNPVAPMPGRSLSPEVERVGMIGRLTPWKGQSVFLRAFARAFAGTDVRATIVGAALFGEDAYEQELHDLAAALEIADRVDFLGFRSDIEAQLESIDICVHASVVPEPFGQVIVEAMAAGVPVVAADGGGAAEIVADGKTALTHPPGDVDALAAALTRLAGDSDLRERLVAAGRERARDFGPEAVAERLDQAYRTLLDG